jgi:multiple sugar transport system substrate-binding protein
VGSRDQSGLWLGRMNNEVRLSRRRLLGMTGAGAGALMLGPLLAACGGSNRGGGAGGPAPSPIETLEPPATAVDLTFWNPFTGPDGEFMKRLVEQFNGETDTITVTMQTQPEYYTRIQSAAQANRLPQIAVMHIDQVPFHAENRIITPIDDLVELLGLSGDDFTEAIWNAGEWKGTRYVVPLDIHPETFYWNKELFERAGLDPESPPTDMESFEEAATAITEEAGVPGFMIVTTGPGAAFLTGNVWASLFYQGGGEWVNEDLSEVTFNSEAGVQAAEYIVKLRDLGVSPASVESDLEIAAFAAGENGMVWSGIWTTSQYIDALGDSVGAAALPQIFGPGGWAGSHNLAVTSTEMSEDERQGAYYFINWISDNAIPWAESGQLPARESVRASEEFAQLEPQATIAEGIDDFRFFPPFPGAPDLLYAQGGAGEAVLAVIAGQKDAQTALDEAAARYTQILQESKQRYDF